MSIPRDFARASLCKCLCVCACTHAYMRAFEVIQHWYKHDDIRGKLIDFGTLAFSFRIKDYGPTDLFDLQI